MSLRIIILLLISSKIYGQCGTDVTSQYLRNPNFDQTACCPSTFSQLNCAAGWFSPNLATPDYFNTCNYTGGTGLNGLLPFPSGQGAIGLIGTTLDPNSFPEFQGCWMEYAATCVNIPSGKTLTFNLNVACRVVDDVLNTCTYQPFPTQGTLAIFGHTSCVTPESCSSFCCPTSCSGWTQLGSVTFTPNTSWRTQSITITTTSTIRTIAFGVTCNLPLDYRQRGCYPYFVIDGISITEPSCNDNNQCTTDNCVNGQCTYTPRSCNDNNLCTTDNCVPNSGCVYAPINCSDLNPCTIDLCNNGVCSHQPRNCNDNNPCTTDGCSGGNCFNTLIVCNDNNFCTTDQCINGLCVYNTRVCNDNNPCTINGCHQALGCVYTPLNCNDNNPCTIDICLN